jgi:hypothetical protein
MSNAVIEGREGEDAVLLSPDDLPRKELDNIEEIKAHEDEIVEPVVLKDVKFKTRGMAEGSES